MLDALVPWLEELGAEVELMPVQPGRTNVLALFGEPRVVFTTYLDTVPPYFPPRLEPGRIVGRGTCDAKGQIVAQLAAIEACLAAPGSPGSRGGFGWLGLVGEESDAAGAHAAAGWRDRLAPCRLLVNGEPTEGLLATGQRGYVHLALACEGRCAHSGSPERGESALWPLIDWLERVREQPLAEDGELGREVWNLGRIEGGSAANVVPAHGRAELVARTLPNSRFRAAVEAARPSCGTLEVLVEEAAERYPRLAGFEYAPMPFGSDLPALRRSVPDAAVALAGCGSISVAHTVDEHLTEAELMAGVALNRRLAEWARSSEKASSETMERSKS